MIGATRLTLVALACAFSRPAVRIGEIRKLRIPHNEGYGAKGFPAWKIPPKATLLFTIEVLEINGSSKQEL